MAIVNQPTTANQFTVMSALNFGWQEDNTYTYKVFYIETATPLNLSNYYSGGTYDPTKTVTVFRSNEALVAGISDAANPPSFLVVTDSVTINTTDSTMVDISSATYVATGANFTVGVSLMKGDTLVKLDSNVWDLTPRA